ncbi:MAG: rane protein [Bacillales bacterium]|jgi:uncharacterized membrane protein YqgA involved in biofilm formation|nr:rane protein [Bacillales bacterium]
MILIGTFVNGALIIIGTLIGLYLKTIPERIKHTVSKVSGLFVIVIGMNMVVTMKNPIIVLLSLTFGAILGEWVDIDQLFNKLGDWIESKVNRKDSNISKAFVSASLIYVIGAMAVVGSLESGLRNNHTILFTKSVIDGVTSIVLTSTLGFGVMVSAIPVILYQGTITLLATKIDSFIAQSLLNKLIDVITVTGGVLILAIGMNMLEITKIKIANLLPSLLIGCLLVTIVYKL